MILSNPDSPKKNKMASGYALPQINGEKYPRGHSAFQSIDYSAAPSATPHFHDHHNELSAGPVSIAANGHLSLHSHKLPMKGRVRGESDLGRPAGSGIISASTTPAMWIEVYTGALLTLQYILFTGSYSSGTPADIVKQSLREDLENKDNVTLERPPIWVYTGILTAMVLIITGTIGRIVGSQEHVDKRRLSNAADKISRNEASVSMNPIAMLRLAISTALPIYASLCLAKATTGLVFVAAVASIAGLGSSMQARPTISQKITKSLGFWIAMGTSMAADLTGLTSSAFWHDVVLGYGLLFISITLLTPPLLDLPPAKLKVTTAARPLEQSSTSRVRPSILTSKKSSTTSVLSGACLATATFLAVVLSRVEVRFSYTALLFGFSGVFVTCITAFLGDIASLKSRRRAGLLAGLGLALLSLEVFRSSSRVKLFCHCGVALGFVLGAIIDSSSSLVASSDKSSVHTGHKHHNHGNVSFLTSFLLTKTNRGSLIYDILSEKDSRRIAYFTWSVQ